VKYRKDLSKSKYLQGLQCPRLLWIAFNQADRIPPPDAATQFIFDQGHLVGEYAQRLFPEGIKLDTGDIGRNLKETTECLSLRRPVFEAGFSAKRLYCRVDVLNPVGEEEWDIIEVKSTNSVKDEHVKDVEFQLHCCLNAGLKVRHCHVMCLDKDYVRQGEIDPARLFTAQDVTSRLGLVEGEFERRLAGMLAIVDSDRCPDVAVGRHCESPNSCPLQVECWTGMSKHNVMTLYGGKKLGEELLARGIINISDIPGDVELSAKQRLQKQCVDCVRPHVDVGAVRRFLAGLQYPLYFMDFETFSTAIPMYDGTRPHQKVPFQFSVHSIAAHGAEPQHCSFLAEGRGDPRPEFARALVGAIVPEGSILVYSAPFEKSMLKDLAEGFPEYRDHLEGIRERVVDLNLPFKNFSFYHPDQTGSASLKIVLPVLTGLNYEQLEIAEGETASLQYMEEAFGDIADEKRQKIRADLIAYCSLDTYGMVEIVHRLCEIVDNTV